MDLGSSAALQARSVFALLMRRIRSEYTGSRAGYLWAIVEPIAWIFVLKLVIQSGNNARPPVGDSFEVFFATGITVARTWRMSVNQTLTIFQRGKSSNLPSIYRLDMVLASWLLEMVTGLVVLAVILTILGLFGFNVTPSNLFGCFFAFAGMAFFALSFGVTYAFVETIAPGLRHFRSIIMIIMFVTSGFSFVLDRMPLAFRAIVSWNPLVHCIEWFREGFYYGYECRSLDLPYLFTTTVLGLLIGLAAERALRHKKPADGAAYGNEEF